MRERCWAASLRHLPSGSIVRMDNLLGSDDNGLFVVCVFVLVGGHSVGARGKALRRGRAGPGCVAWELCFDDDVTMLIVP